MSEQLNLTFKTLSSPGLATEAVKKSQTRKVKCWSSHFTKSGIYRSPPLDDR